MKIGSLLSSMIAAVALCGAWPASAQRAQRDAVPLVDPLYVEPAGSLSEREVAELQRRLRDWPGLARYRDENAALPAADAGAPRVVFYGDSITDAWGRSPGTTFFAGKPYLNRGISRQTTAQMLLRFRQDVIALRPAVVVVLAGTNDIAGNTGVATLPMIEDNLRSMRELARANGIRVVLASVLPVSAYPWRPGLRPAGTVRALNAWLRAYAAATDAVYLDYHAALANADGGMDAAFAADGVHPTPAGYAVMAPLAQRAIDEALARQASRSPEPR
jgi:lysophospholipase L1-like esterase